MIRYIPICLFFILLLGRCTKKEEPGNPCPKPDVYYGLTKDTILLNLSGNDSMWMEVADSTGKIFGTFLFTGQGKRYHTEMVAYEIGGDCPRKFYGDGYSVCYISGQHKDSFILSYTQFELVSRISLKYTDLVYENYLYPGSSSYNHFGLVIKDKVYHRYEKMCARKYNSYQDFYNCVRYPFYFEREKGFLQVVTPYGAIFTRIFK